MQGGLDNVHEGVKGLNDDHHLPEVLKKIMRGLRVLTVTNNCPIGLDYDHDTPEALTMTTVPKT